MTVFLMQFDYGVSRLMTPGTQSPWTSPQKNKWWEETLFY